MGIPSSIGVAAAAAYLLSLDAQQTLHALAIAGGMAGWCPADVIFGNGSSFKPLLLDAQPADTGVTAAYYALAGMTGPVDLFDSKLGYFATASTGGALGDGGGNASWALAQPRRKLHACCGNLHAPADALAQLLLNLGPAMLQTARIAVRVAPYVANVVAKDRRPMSAN